MSVAGPLTLHRPLNSASKGEVILLPGWSGPRSGPADILVFLASRLAENGWTAVRIDLPGRGDAEGGAAVDLDAMIASAAKAVSELPLTPNPSPPRREGDVRVLIGICSGGNVALGAAPLKECASFDRVVAISTFPFQPARTRTFDRRRRWKNIKQYARKALSPSTWMRLIRGEVNVARVTKNVAASEKPAEGRNLKDSARDIENELSVWKGAALFVWGGGDEEAPPARVHFEKLHAVGMGAPGRVRFHTVNGANHNFYGKAWREELLREILEFLDMKQDRAGGTPAPRVTRRN
ncbi:MAG TPA: alpha/beta hydrolase [Planctomycetota bacterium]|nr:alpha/beta hydrolase [Planctomycetota bacterium]